MTCCVVVNGSHVFSYAFVFGLVFVFWLAFLYKSVRSSTLPYSCNVQFLHYSHVVLACPS